MMQIIFDLIVWKPSQGSADTSGTKMRGYGNLGGKETNDNAELVTPIHRSKDSAERRIKKLNIRSRTPNCLNLNLLQNSSKHVSRVWL